MIEKYLVGWEAIEGVVLGCVSNGLNLMLLGKHGCGKSSIARFIAKSMEQSKVVVYHCDKENLISAVGIPDPNALKEGKVRYATHERSMFNADIIILDELPRASKEGQNMFLEALEEKTIFGFPLKYKFIVATGNDETYKSNYKLDAALLDRFFCVVPAPTTTENRSGSEELAKMIALNMGDREANMAQSNKALSESIVKIRNEYNNLWLDSNIKTNVIEFSSRFFSILMGNIRNAANNKDNSNKQVLSNIYIPPRIIGNQFPRVILAIAAYYKAIKGNTDTFLQLGAADAIKYTLSTKLGIPIDLLMKVYDNLKIFLNSGNNDLNKIKVAISTGSPDAIMAAFVAYKESIKQLEICDIVSAVGNLLQQNLTQDHDVQLIQLYRMFKETNMNATCLNSIKLKILDKRFMEMIKLDDA